jgi:FRG domain
VSEILRNMGDSEEQWYEFLNNIETARTRLGCGSDCTDEAWFRGHTKSSYPLLPSLFRNLDNPISSDQWTKIWNLERDLFWEFSARARELHGVLDDDWDFLFAMQHYGTPTRLLDWTEVLGVAIYFATLGIDEQNENDNESDPPCIWVLNPYKLNESSTFETGDLIYPKVLGWSEEEGTYYTYGELLMEDKIDWEWPVAIYPRQRNARLHAQRAWFTIHGDNFVAMDDGSRHQHCLEKVTLPFAVIKSAKRFLQVAGIDHYLLFADLESLSLHLREKNGLLSRIQAETAAQRRSQIREGSVQPVMNAETNQSKDNKTKRPPTPR